MPSFHQQDPFPLHYETAGQGEPLVFLNGIMMTVGSWAYQRSFFKKGYRCIFHDFRDQLRSAPQEAPYDLSLHADDLLALLDRLGIRRAHLLGTSYGGEVGMIFAYTYPERVQSLTIVASVSYVEPLLREQVLIWKQTALIAPELLYASLVSLSFSNDFLKRNPELVADGTARLATYPPAFFAGFARLCDAFLQLDITDRLPDISCPTLVVAAEQDILKTPAYSHVIRKQIPAARLEVIPGAGHAVVLEQPKQVNTLVSGFLQTHAMKDI